MKHIITIIILVIIVVSCSESQTTKLSIDGLIAEGNEVTLKKKQIELKNQLQSVNEDLEKIEEVLNSDDNNAKNPLVTTFIAKESNFMHFLELQGNVVTKQNIILYPEFAGTLTNMYVKEGQLVKRGQKLARVDDGGLSQQIAQVEVQIAFSETTYQRQKRLWEQKIGSEIQYLQAKAQAEAQANAVLQLEKVLAKAQITAPFSGVIDQVLKDPGTVVSPGNRSEVFRLINLSHMYIEVDVPEGYLGAVTKGKKAGVYFPVLQDSVNAVVRETGNYINPNNRSFSAEIAVNNPNGSIKPNLNARVHINDYTNENALLIPQSVISENAAGEQYAYVAELNNGEAIAKRHIITTGKTQGDFVEITSGISAGDLIIKEGARSVKDAQAVKILN